MDIVYLGHASFKISGKNASVITDPFDPSMVGLKYPRVSADIVTVSHEHADHNNIAAVEAVHKVVNGPGEYEINGISIIGIPSFHDSKKGEERGKNTIYVFEIDGFRVVHLGDLGHSLSESVLEELGDVDVLLIPVGGTFTLDATEAVSVAQAIAPRIIIPMHYQVTGLATDIAEKLTPVETFTTALGSTAETTKKFSVKQGSPITDEMKLVILDRS